jgi:hypothetical protein
MEEDPFNIAIEKIGKSGRYPAATGIPGAKIVLLLTLFASICGWLWLLGKGAIAIVELLSGR